MSEPMALSADVENSAVQARRLQGRTVVSPRVPHSLLGEREDVLLRREGKDGRRQLAEVELRAQEPESAESRRSVSKRNNADAP